MRLRHEARPKKTFLNFSVNVDFWFARIRDGVIPISILPPVPLTQSQIKIKQAQAKSAQVEELVKRQRAMIIILCLEIQHTFPITAESLTQPIEGKILKTCIECRFATSLVYVLGVETERLASVPRI